MCAKAAKMIWNKRVLIEGPQSRLKIVPFLTLESRRRSQKMIYLFEVLKKGANQ